MVRRQTAQKIRKIHRYLGIFLGLQFLMWTISGMYFSWTDLDEIHGDQFRRAEVKRMGFTDLLATEGLGFQNTIESMELLDIAGEPYYWINRSALFNAKTGAPKEKVTEAEAMQVADRYMLPGLEVSGIQLITTVSDHHEYRGGPLPAYEISYATPENLKVYVAEANGKFQTVRHRSWRWFDFLWMTHTMDYDTRDNFNTLVLRAFSLLGLITVLSGFVLWYISSPTIRKMRSGN